MEVFKKHVFVCVSGKTCPTQGGVEVCDALRKEIADRGLKGEIRINKAGCFNQCGNGPMVVVYPDATWYSHVRPGDAKEIVQSHLTSNKPVARLLYKVKPEIKAK